MRRSFPATLLRRSPPACLRLGDGQASCLLHETDLRVKLLLELPVAHLPHDVGEL